MEPILIILSLLTISIITLVFVVVWRDRRDLKLRQITGEIEKVEELLKEMDQYKKEIKEMLATAKKQTDQAVSRVDNQVKQVRDSVVKLEQHVHSGSKDSRDSGRGKPRNPNKKGQTTPPPPSKGGEQDQRINDGEKFAKMVKMADEGLNTQEIAKRLNIGRKEVELVLQLKRKQIS
jgi:DNA anti-recombination protein RmuC